VGLGEISPTIFPTNASNKQSTAHTIIPHSRPRPVKVPQVPSRSPLVSSLHVPRGISFDRVVPFLIKWLTRHSSSSNLTQPITALPPAPCRAIGETYGPRLPAELIRTSPTQGKLTAQRLCFKEGSLWVAFLFKLLDTPNLPSSRLLLKAPVPLWPFRFLLACLPSC
jgi:hypothetical protein